MMSNVNTKPNEQSANAPKTAANGATHAPSVPISLYREVADELQTTRTDMQSLKTQNQELTQKNQQLRLEIERVVQSALHLRQMVDPTWGSPNLEAIASSNSDRTTRDSSTKLLAASGAVGADEKRFTEQEATPLQPASSQASAEISTWWLILIICSIVITAFGTGFLIVRPLLPSR